MPVKVVKVNQRQDNFTRYCGRAWAGLPESVFCNPFHVGVDGNREEVLLKFIAYWYAKGQWRRVSALGLMSDDEILGCWCHPLACHCDIIAGYVNWRRQEPTLW